MQWPDQLVCSYFFNARSPHELEKCPKGLYQSWLYELLTNRPELRSVFQAAFALKLVGETVEEWTEAELTNFLIDLFSEDVAI